MSFSFEAVFGRFTLVEGDGSVGERGRNRTAEDARGNDDDDAGVGVGAEVGAR